MMSKVCLWSFILVASVGSFGFQNGGETPEEKEKGEPKQNQAEETGPEVHETLAVRQRADALIGNVKSASEGATGKEDVSLRPVLRSGELLETIPGLIVTQHSGDGKANQYFLRGFNLDHGTDLRINLDHMQINMPTHGHGQGYADLNILIPELVDTVQFRKGPYDAASGDFSAAGSTEIRYVDVLEKPLVKLSGGSFDFQRALLAWSTELPQRANLMAAMEIQDYDGPWERPNDSRKLNGVVRWSQGDSSMGSSLTFMGYDQDWLSTDQIPLRAVQDGSLSRYGLLDPDLGGNSSRYSLSYEGHRVVSRSRQDWYVYLAKHELELFSNFTYFLEDADQGDEFMQVDERSLGGMGYQYRWFQNWGGREVDTSIGFQARLDQIDNALMRSQARISLGSVRDDEVFQVGAGVYGSQEIHWNGQFRTVLGLRYDRYFADVEDQLAINSGTSEDGLLSPKLNIAWQQNAKLEYFFNFGYGFHSNDARGTTIRVDPTNLEPATQVPALVRARGMDIGMVTNPWPGMQSSLSLFGLDLDSELVFVGDGGGTEAGRPSRRTGIELANHFRIASSWVLDLDMSWAKGRFTDNDPVGDRIPGAVSRVIAAGIAYEGSSGFLASLRYRHFGGVSLNESNSVRGQDTHQVNSQVALLLADSLSLGLEVFNLLNREDPDIQYFYASRLPGEPAEGVEDIHFHPIEKRGVRFFLKWGF